MYIGEYDIRRKMANESTLFYIYFSDLDRWIDLEENQKNTLLSC